MPHKLQSKGTTDSFVPPGNYQPTLVGVAVGQPNGSMSSGGGDEHSRSLDDVDDADIDNDESNTAFCIAGGKLLKSAEPDLEVVVGQGDDTRTYRHYSIVLASYSDYIDTMLSVPMREQETRRITFPDITPANFDKIMMMHQINGRRELRSFANKEEAPVLLPLLDKYQFIDALGAWDALLAKLFGGWMYQILAAGDLQNAIALAQAAHGLNATCMEKSQPKMAKFAIDKLQDMPTSLTAENVKVLLSLLDQSNGGDDDDDIVLAIAQFIEIANDDIGRYVPSKRPNLRTSILNRFNWHFGRQRGSIDLAEMRDIIKEAGFAERLRMRTLQLSEQDDMMRRLVVKRLQVDAPPTASNDGLNLVMGEYLRKDAEVDGHVAKEGKVAGAKRFCYTRHYTSEEGDAMKIVIEPYDLLGTKWVMTDYDLSDGAFKFLFFWENEFGSLLPPKYGWKRASHEEDDNPNSIFDNDNPTLHYNIESRTW